MEALTFKKQAAQGDLLIRRVDKIPDDAKEVLGKNRLVLAHSETGHHHAIKEHPTVCHFRQDNQPLISFLEVSGDAVILEHQRPWDTHAPILVEKGTYEIRRQREYVPEGWRRVED